MNRNVEVGSVAEAYLELLASRNIEYFFGNGGTDFAPIIEAYAKRVSQEQPLPRPITVPHEGPAVAMATGVVAFRAGAMTMHCCSRTSSFQGSDNFM